MTQKPRLLLVEDAEPVRRNLCKRFAAPPPALADEFQVRGFEVTAAATGAEAEQFLSEAEKRMQPYDVLVLDLGLPRTHPEDRAEAEVGLGLLGSSVKEMSCAAVVIQSHHDDRPTIIRALQHGAIDFIPKPFMPEELLPAVFRAWRVGQQRSRVAWDRFRSEHLLKQITAWMYREGQASAADRVGRAASDGVAEVLHRLHEAGARLPDDAPRDGTDDVRRAIVAACDAALRILDGCAEAHNAPDSTSPALSRVVLGELVKGALDRFALGIAYKRIRLEFNAGPHIVLPTFEEDVRSIVDAIVFQALDAAPLGSAMEVRIERATGGQVAVRVTAREVYLPFCYPDGGEVYLPGREMVWGLALARRLAHDAYGHIEEEVTAQGQTVSLYLPTVDDATGAHCR